MNLGRINCAKMKFEVVMTLCVLSVLTQAGKIPLRLVNSSASINDGDVIRFDLGESCSPL